ncbi:MAG: Cna B-type domain-containing protein, partial [Oscillospiraceae bacterium]|nr:Cna B-type domain-containing protein [Oscillospiraceae bacterium]
MKSKKPAKYISLMIASALSLSVLFFAEYAMDVHATETQDSGQLQVMENTEQLQTEPQDKETTKAESDNESTGSGTDEGMAADVKVKATSRTNNIIGEVFANMFNDGDDEKAKAKREASLEEYPFEFHDLDYYGDSLRVRVLEGGDEEGSNYLAYRDSYLLIGEEESGNYSVEFSKDGREAYVSPAIPASELEDKMGVVFLADYVGDDVILVFDGEPAYDADTMTVPVLTTEDITVNMLFSDVKLSIEQPQAKKQTKSNSKGISLKADPPGGYYKLISGTNWHGAVTGFSVDEQAVIPVIDIPNKQVNVNFIIRTTLEFDIVSAPSPGGDEEDIVKITELEFPAEVLDFTYEYNMLVRFDKTPVHVKGKINSELVYNIGADGNNEGGVRITEFHNPVTLDTFELVNQKDVNKPISFFIGSQFKAKGQMYPLIRDQSVYALNIKDQDFRGGCEFGALHLKDKYTERGRSEAEIHTCLKKGRKGCLALQVDEVQKNKIQAVINMIFVEREVGIANGGYRTVDSHQLYNSLTYGSGFVEGHCPHKFYRIPVRVVSSEGATLPGMNVTVRDPIDLLNEEEAALAKDRTNDDGEAAIYLPYKEDYKYTVVAEGQVYGAPVSGSKQQINNFHRGDNELVKIILDTDFVNLKGQITWEGDEGKEHLRPNSVHLQVVTMKGEIVEELDVSAEDDWKYELKKLPGTDSEGYRVVQDGVSGYTPFYSDPPSSYDGQTHTWTSDVTNYLTGYCAIDIEKKITGDAPENPETYTFQVEPINEGVPGAQRATEPINESIEITGAGKTKVEFMQNAVGLFYYKFTEKKGEDSDCKYDEKEWFVIISTRVIRDGDGISGVETKSWVVDDLNNINLDEAEESDTVTFTNKYPNATVKKEWDIDLEDKDRPESIQVLVQKKSKDNEDDKDKWTDVKVIELSEENDWEAKFFREDDSAEYRVRELKEENALTNLINELRTMIKGSASASYEDIINKIKGSEYYNKLPEGVRNAADQGKDKLIKELGTTEAKLYDKLIETLDLAAAADRVVYDEKDSDKPKGKDGKDDPETNAVRYHVDDHHTKYQVSYEDEKDDENEEVQNYTITNKAIVEVDVIKRWVTFGVEDEDIPDSAWLVLMCKPNPEALESAKSIPGVDLSDLLDYEFPVINPISGGNNPISIISELVLGIDIDIFGIFDKTTPKLAIAKAEKKDDGEEGNWTVHFTDSKYHMGIPMEYKGAELSSEVIKQIIKYVSKGTINLPISYNPFSNYFSIPTKAIRTIAGITDVNQVLDLSGLSQKLLDKAKGLTVEDVKKFGPENILDDDQLMANVINIKIDSDSNDDPDDEKITISGSKTWDDNNNKAGKRPESITV